jgi:hypothetical protein
VGYSAEPAGDADGDADGHDSGQADAP